VAFRHRGDRVVARDLLGTGGIEGAQGAEPAGADQQPRPTASGEAWRGNARFLVVTRGG